MAQAKIESIVPHLIGIDTRHGLEFKIDRPCDPAGMALFMCFRTPAVILTERGLAGLSPGDCIVHDPFFRQVHHSAPGASEGFRNDWVHVDYAVAKRLMKRLGLPWNSVLSTGRGDIFEPCLKQLMTELESPDELSDASVEASLFSMLLAVLRASREGALMQETMSPAERGHFLRMRALRAATLERFREPCDVRSLAREAGLSPERFSALYRKFFRRSPIAELLDARVLAAKRLLAYSQVSVKEAALACGFEDVHYFSRLFRRRAGMPPAECRARHLR